MIKTPFDMNYLVDPQTLLFNSHRISGFTQMISEYNIPQWTLLETALEVAEEWTEEWDENEGFGSSDMTYMMQDFINNIIYQFASGKLMTKFTPSLSIVEYSEADHHEKVQRMESGI
jgi:hypothetical protein